MKTRKLILLALVVTLLTAMAAPAAAHTRRVTRGDIDITFRNHTCADGRYLTWTGTVTIDGEVYGWADFPTAPLVVKGDWMYFQEYWTIFALADGEVPTNEAACDPSRVLIDGTNDGIGTPWFTGFAWGTVDSTFDGGPFDHIPIGSLMLWRGYLVEQRPIQPGDRFLAKLSIIARR